MNQLLLKCLLATGQLKKGMTIDVDFDHVFLPCEKKDATFSYKQKYGYFPGVLMSGGLILGSWVGELIPLYLPDDKFRIERFRFGLKLRYELKFQQLNSAIAEFRSY